MKVEQFIALRGKGGNGTARISTDDKNTEIELVMRSKSAQPLTAYLVTDRGTVAVPLANNRHGVTRCDADIRAVLIACNEGGDPGFLLAGTAMGAHVSIEEAMRDIRMRSTRSSTAKTGIGKSSASAAPSGVKTANPPSSQRRTADMADRTTEALPSSARRTPVSGSGARQSTSVKNAPAEGPVTSASKSKDAGGRTANSKETAAVRSPGKAVEYETLNANTRSTQGGSALKSPSTNNTNQKNGQSPRPSAGSKADAGSSGEPNVLNPTGNRNGDSSISRSSQSGQTQAQSTRPTAPLKEPGRSDNAANPNGASGVKPTNNGPVDSGRGDNVRPANAPHQAPKAAALHPDQSGRKCQIESAHNETGNRQSGESPVLNDILKRADILFRAPVQPAKAGINKMDVPRRAASSGVREEIPVYNPFPDAFPRSVWKRVVYPGTSRYYLEGEVVKDGARYLVHALPGEYGAAMQRGNGFSRFMRSADGTGYWLRIRRI